MTDTIQVDFRGLQPSPELRAMVEEQVARLQRFEPRISTCRVQVAAPHRHHRQGNEHEVHVEVGVPGGPLVVTRRPGDDATHVDLELAVRDAFRAARRRLQDRARRRRGQVKLHEEPPHARVALLVPSRDHGFLETRNGRQVYFHRNAVLGGGFDALAPGSEVTFVEEEGERGPQASTVRPLARRRPRLR